MQSKGGPCRSLYKKAGYVGVCTAIEAHVGVFIAREGHVGVCSVREAM